MLGLVGVYRCQRQSLPRLDPVTRVVGLGRQVFHHDSLLSLAGVFLRVSLLAQNTPSPFGYVPGHSGTGRKAAGPSQKGLRVVLDEDRTRERLPEGVGLRVRSRDDRGAIQVSHRLDPQPPPGDEIAICEVVEHRGVWVPDLEDAEPLTRDGLAQSEGVVNLQN